MTRLLTGEGIAERVEMQMGSAGLVEGLEPMEVRDRDVVAD